MENLRRLILMLVVTVIAGPSLARVEYAWSEAFAAPHVATTNGLSVKPGDQHVLYFSNGVVRVHHLVTDRWFDLQGAPFKECSAVEKLDDGRLLVVDGAGEKAVYGTPARTKTYHPVNWAVIIVYLLRFSDFFGYTIIWWNGIFGFTLALLVTWAYYLSGRWQHGAQISTGA